MKFHSFVFILCCCTSFFCRGQYNSEGENKSRFRPGIMWYNTGWKPAQLERVRKYDRLMFDFSYNDWNGERPTFQMQGISFGMNINWLYEFPLTKKNLISIAFGPGYGFYRLQHNIPSVYTVDKATIFGNLNDQGYFGNRKLIGRQLYMPFELRIRTNGWKHVKFHIGGKIGYQLSLFEKANFKHLDGKIIQTNQPMDVNRWFYALHVRFGIRNYAFYSSYNLNPFFKNSKSTQLHLLQFGLTLSLF